MKKAGERNTGKPHMGKTNFIFIVSHMCEKVKRNGGESRRFGLDKDIKDRTCRGMKRTTYSLRKGKIIYVEEYHQGNYGAPGKRREKKKEPTKEQVKLVNRMTKMKNCRLRLMEYFTEGDIFATWTYNPRERPPDMKAALCDFQKAIRKVRAAYKKRGRELFWIRNIEKGTKGAWHIHLIVNEIGDTVSILQKAWEHGGTYANSIKLNDKVYDEDFTKLSSYITKTAGIGEKREDGKEEKPRIRESSYGTSRNMPIPEPTEKELVRWKREAVPVKGYYMVNCYEGSNPVTGYPYRQYTMVRITDPPEKKKRKGNVRCRKKKK